jgi:hypothetical protein
MLSKQICFSVERGIIDISKMQLAMNWITDKYASKTPKCEKLTDDGREVMAKAHLTFGKVI